MILAPRLTLHAAAGMNLSSAIATNLTKPRSSTRLRPGRRSSSRRQGVDLAARLDLPGPGGHGLGVGDIREDSPNSISRNRKPKALIDSAPPVVEQWPMFGPYGRHPEYP